VRKMVARKIWKRPKVGGAFEKKGAVEVNSKVYLENRGKRPKSDRAEKSFLGWLPGKTPKRGKFEKKKKNQKLDKNEIVSDEKAGII